MIKEIIRLDNVQIFSQFDHIEKTFCNYNNNIELLIKYVSVKIIEYLRKKLKGLHKYNFEYMIDVLTK